MAGGTGISNSFCSCVDSQICSYLLYLISHCFHSSHGTTQLSVISSVGQLFPQLFIFPSFTLALLPTFPTVPFLHLSHLIGHNPSGWSTSGHELLCQVTPLADYGSVPCTEWTADHINFFGKSNCIQQVPNFCSISHAFS